MITHNDIFVGGDGGYHSYRIPALVMAGNGTLLAFCEGRKHSQSDQGRINILLKRSMDGGNTWSKQTVVYEEGGDESSITVGNPCPVANRATNTICLLFTTDNRRVFCMTSVDGGLTWSFPQEHSHVLQSFDFGVARIGIGPGHGICTQPGRLVAPIWLCDGEAGDNTRQFRSAIIYSDDNGRTWNAGGVVLPKWKELNECAVIERANQDLLLNMRATGSGSRVVSISRDGGSSWSEPVQEEALPCPVCQASLLHLSGTKVAFSNPAVSRKGPNNAGGRRNMTVRLSLDEAVSWPYSQVLHEGPSAYSDLAVAEDGQIFCLYECGERLYYEKICLARFNVGWIMGAAQTSVAWPWAMGYGGVSDLRFEIQD